MPDEHPKNLSQMPTSEHFFIGNKNAIIEYQSLKTYGMIPVLQNVAF
jgi:hypothetical protein